MSTVSEVSTVRHPLRASHSDRRQMLIGHFSEVVEPLLHEHSYASLSVAQLIDAAAISRTSFYAYFEGKTDLLAAMAGQVMQEVLEAGEGWWGLPTDASKTELRDALRAVVDTWREHRLLLRSVTESTYQEASARDLYAKLVGTAAKQVTAYIEASQAAGTAAPDIHPAHTAELLMYLAERSLYQIVGVENDPDYARFPDAMSEIFWRTVCEGFR